MEEFAAFWEAGFVVMGEGMLRVRKDAKREVGVYWDFDDLRIFR